jgi:hypothetical protein
VHGLRARNSAAQIATFEWGAARASAAVGRVVRGTKPGQTELAAMAALRYAGEPMVCHPVFTSGSGQLNGLRSPTARRIERGDAAAVAVGYWGGLCCRAGLVTDGPDEDFLATLVRPYYAAIATWYATIGIGVAGGDLHAAVIEALGDATFRPALNPGHLTSYEEWLHSPVRPGSEERIASGTMFQCDIIPAPVPPGRLVNCEDTVALADGDLREELARNYPAVWRRIEARRAFMLDELGLQIRPELLPLSTMPAYLPPFWLTDSLVCVVAG